MNLFDTIDIDNVLNDFIISTEDFKLDVPRNNEVPTKVDENGQAKPDVGVKPTIIQSKCPITIDSVDIDGKSITTVHAYIRGPIDDLDGYIPLLNLLNTASEDVVFFLHIQSGGGMVTTGATISSSIASCKGKVITIAEGLCASAASLIWSAGHECIVGDYAMFMYHMSSHADMNNSLYIAESAQKMVNYVQSCLMRSALEKGHITKEDFIAFCENKEEVWISAEQMKQRLGLSTTPEENIQTEIVEVPAEEVEVNE